jgi:hypothetical protein
VKPRKSAKQFSCWNSKLIQGNISYTLHFATSYLEVFNCPFANVSLERIVLNMIFRLLKKKEEGVDTIPVSAIV